MLQCPPTPHGPGKSPFVIVRAELLRRLPLHVEGCRHHGFLKDAKPPNGRTSKTTTIGNNGIGEELPGTGLPQRTPAKFRR